MMARNRERRQLNRLIRLLRQCRGPLDRDAIEALLTLPPGPLDGLARELHEVLSEQLSMGLESRALQREFGRVVQARTRQATSQLRQE